MSSLLPIRYGLRFVNRCVLYALVKKPAAFATKNQNCPAEPGHFLTGYDGMPYSGAEVCSASACRTPPMLPFSAS